LVDRPVLSDLALQVGQALLDGAVHLDGVDLVGGPRLPFLVLRDRGGGRDENAENRERAPHGRTSVTLIESTQKFPRSPSSPYMISRSEHTEPAGSRAGFALSLGTSSSKSTTTVRHVSPRRIEMFCF